ncbi:MAG: hypothetical protein AW10_00316 [Candidatus Accumulibacter appositus]|uniref:Uncharacterized protein n=1 Tax=Candidatus Accumulibacter appositus TaxID=1454003 RepID=A0A011P5K5_9PROT|nr:MAG: hypothetical protein AW10_00316 [Candidatus Accumulibacter appositus]
MQIGETEVACLKLVGGVFDRRNRLVSACRSVVDGGDAGAQGHRVGAVAVARAAARKCRVVGNVDAVAGSRQYAGRIVDQTHAQFTWDAIPVGGGLEAQRISRGQKQAAGRSQGHADVGPAAAAVRRVLPGPLRGGRRVVGDDDASQAVKGGAVREYRLIVLGVAESSVAADTIEQLGDGFLTWAGGVLKRIRQNDAGAQARWCVVFCVNRQRYGVGGSGKRCDAAVAGGVHLGAGVAGGAARLIPGAQGQSGGHRTVRVRVRLKVNPVAVTEQQGAALLNATDRDPGRTVIHRVEPGAQCRVRVGDGDALQRIHVDVAGAAGQRRHQDARHANNRRRVVFGRADGEDGIRQHRRIVYSPQSDGLCFGRLFGTAQPLRTGGVDVAAIAIIDRPGQREVFLLRLTEGLPRIAIGQLPRHALGFRCADPGSESKRERAAGIGKRADDTGIDAQVAAGEIDTDVAASRNAENVVGVGAGNVAALQRELRATPVATAARQERQFRVTQHGVRRDLARCPVFEELVHQTSAQGQHRRIVVGGDINHHRATAFQRQQRVAAALRRRTAIGIAVVDRVADGHLRRRVVVAVAVGHRPQDLIGLRGRRGVVEADGQHASGVGETAHHGRVDAYIGGAEIDAAVAATGHPESVVGSRCARITKHCRALQGQHRAAPVVESAQLGVAQGRVGVELDCRSVLVEARIGDDAATEIGKHRCVVDAGNGNHERAGGDQLATTAVAPVVERQGEHIGTAEIGVRQVLQLVDGNRRVDGGDAAAERDRATADDGRDASVEVERQCAVQRADLQLDVAIARVNNILRIGEGDPGDDGRRAAIA